MDKETMELMEEREHRLHRDLKHNKFMSIITTIQTVLSVIIIVLLLCHHCDCCKCNQGNVDPNPTPSFNTDLDDDVEWGDRETPSKEQIREELNQKVEEGMMNISMNTNTQFENGTAKGNLLIVNEEINRYAQVVQIYRDDTGELIYTSGAIPVGARVDQAQLDVDLDKGVYPCTAHFNQIDENGNLLGKACARITIYVLG